jgi:hypothetical protein
MAFLPQMGAAMNAAISDKSSYWLMVYYHPNCATTTSHAAHDQTLPSPRNPRRPPMR